MSLRARCKIFSGLFRKTKIREAIWENRTGNGAVPEFCRRAGGRGWGNKTDLRQFIYFFFLSVKTVILRNDA